MNAVMTTTAQQIENSGFEAVATCKNSWTNAVRESSKIPINKVAELTDDLSGVYFSIKIASLKKSDQQIPTIKGETVKGTGRFTISKLLNKLTSLQKKPNKFNIHLKKGNRILDKPKLI